MPARIFVLCLLSSIISTVASLKCQVCFASKKECKNEDMVLVECGPGEEHCLSLSFHSTMIAPPLSFTSKTCATANQCSKVYYGATSVAGKYHQMRIECCENDGCNAGPFPIPGRDVLKPNGFICPGSYEQNHYSKENGTVLCLGDENQCFSGKLTFCALSAYCSTVTARGCTTKNSCAYPIGETEEARGLLRYNLEKMECQNPEGMEGWNGFSKRFGY